MAQDPFRADQYKIEGDSEVGLGERVIYDDPLDGSLRFRDPRIPGGVNLTALAGIQQLARTLVVTPDGIGASKDADGNPITTIQKALDQVPTSADYWTPWLIVVGPGVYVEDIQWSKDYTTLVGLGGVILRSSTATSTVRVLAGVGSIPQRMSIQNVTIENSVANSACIDFLSSTYATGTFTVVTNPNVGDIVTVNGVALTAILNGSIPAPGEFELGLTTTETAENLVVAINDPVNLLDSTVKATSSVNIVTVRAYEPGVGGNAITLASSVPLVITPSGATLSGGTDESVGSFVGFVRATIRGCRLIAQTTPCYQIRAKAINNVEVLDCDGLGSNVGSITDFRECASVRMTDVRDLVGLEMHYDSGAASLPALAGTSTYTLLRVSGISTFNTFLDGVGDVVGTSVDYGPLNISGDRSWTFTRSVFGATQIGGANPTVVFQNCHRGVLTGFGTGTLEESVAEGTVSFAATVFESVVFAIPQPNTNYTVLFENLVLTDPATVFNKTVAGFDVGFGAAQTLTLRYIVYRIS